VSVAANVTNSEIAKILDAFTQVIGTTLSKYDFVRIVGFGTFRAVKIQQRTVRNPQNGKAMVLPEHFRPVFRPGKGLKEAANKALKKK